MCVSLSVCVCVCVFVFVRHVLVFLFVAVSLLQSSSSSSRTYCVCVCVCVLLSALSLCPSPPPLHGVPPKCRQPVNALDLQELAGSSFGNSWQNREETFFLIKMAEFLTLARYKSVMLQVMQVLVKLNLFINYITLGGTY